MASAIERAAGRLRKRAGGALEVGVVCGSGLSESVIARFPHASVPYRKLDGAPLARLSGHPGVAHVGPWAGKRVVAFAGRVHAYQGHAADDVAYFVRLAAAAGAKTIVLTNAAGGLDPAFARGDLMLVSDHLNLMGSAPLDIARDGFVSMVDAYAPHLRALARSATVDGPLREGVYAGVRGPAYETLAEARALRTLGADAVGMSTVFETIAARALGLDVLAISTITNVIGPSDVSHDEVLAVSHAAGARLARTIEAVLLSL